MKTWKACAERKPKWKINVDDKGVSNIHSKPSLPKIIKNEEVFRDRVGSSRHCLHHGPHDVSTTPLHIGQGESEALASFHMLVTCKKRKRKEEKKSWSVCPLFPVRTLRPHSRHVCCELRNQLTGGDGCALLVLLFCAAFVHNCCSAAWCVAKNAKAIATAALAVERRWRHWSTACCINCIHSLQS